jgi:pantoate--beta-alanine ligase
VKPVWNMHVLSPADLHFVVSGASIQKASMQIISSLEEMRTASRCAHADSKRIVLVPTMGALHEGHLELIREARKLADYTIVSVFVNPTQFGPTEDFNAYPRDLEDDRRRVDALGCVDVIFAPDVGEMYPDGTSMTFVSVEKMAEHLCGASRENHFRGVGTVVTKLFNICRPDVAVFGLKDAQQYFLIRRLVFDLNIPTEIIGVPTVREEDGLARSSRNKYLTKEERRQAPVLSEALSSVRTEIQNGERLSRRLIQMLRTRLSSATLGRIDYTDIVQTKDFQPVEILESGETVVAAIAVYFGNARLIDNAIILVP